MGCIYLARSPTGQGREILGVPKESKVRSVMVWYHRQVALFAHVRSPRPDKIDCIYLARSSTSQLIVHDQGAVLRAVPKESKVRSVVECNQRQVALFAHVRSPKSDKIDCILPCQVAHEPAVCARSGGGAEGGVVPMTGPAGRGSDFLRVRLNPPRWWAVRHAP
jgi:hypothetical protein